MLNMLNNSNAVTMSGPPHFVDLHLNPGKVFYFKPSNCQINSFCM